ncbi:putative reverse transcriptase domain-containing protein [Tanacetum coccineum]
MYPPTTSESSAGDSSSELSAGPSHKRCRSLAATVTSSIHATRALVPSRADLLPPRQRFRDSFSPEDSIDMEVDVRVNVEDEVEDEVESMIEYYREGLQDIYEHVMEIPLQRIEDIETGQRELESRSLIVSGDRASLLEQDAAFAMSWRELMKLMAEVYCPRNEIQKIESELWNLTVKNNDLANYTQRL